MIRKAPFSLGHNTNKIYDQNWQCNGMRTSQSKGKAKDSLLPWSTIYFDQNHYCRTPLYNMIKTSTVVINIYNISIYHSLFKLSRKFCNFQLALVRRGCCFGTFKKFSCPFKIYKSLLYVLFELI